MVTKLAKFHGDSASGKKVNFNLASAIEPSKTAVLCAALYRNPIQVRNRRN